jgi:peptidylprolyl isomerase
MPCSTLDEGQTAFSFKVGVGQVIKGWDESVIQMELDEEAEVTCSPDYAYGASGFPAWGYPFS